ncbi:GNAT family N-acetyltransferase [Actinoplanes sp. NPDC051861]|uniref:GNAT family N-acetyltransferase n=1 Tax=Actinoplanes sp. NPDC051861 TaxID=3155170 RepID=UPI003448E1E9
MDISVRPANAASWDDLRAIFGTRGEPARCQCQWFKITAAEWRTVPVEERARRLHEQTGCDDPAAPSTSGLVAYVGDDPAGWCAVESRTVYPRLGTARVPWAGRDERRTDAGVWAVTCFVTRTGYRRRGVSRALATAAISFAHARGARALEGYPIVTRSGQEYSWGELYVGSHKIFLEAGFTEVSRPTPRRAVMRVDF